MSSNLAAISGEESAFVCYQLISLTPTWAVRSPQFCSKQKICNTELGAKEIEATNPEI